ncbi:PD-(D/E)XK nuclease superfamily protein [Mycobacterium xenopi 3993]|nr:PD-(D/E)XK nuclease superfamily protein [Mycobacterium xenopi 3993]
MEESVIVSPATVETGGPPTGFEVRHFHRAIDTGWRRTSYSALVREPESVDVASEPEATTRDDEVDSVVVTAPAPGLDIASPLAAMPSGAAFGSLVHAVLETADPSAADLQAELDAQVRRHLAWWPVDVAADELASALVPMHDTPLGPLAAGLTLRQIGAGDRLRELDFEMPMASGDLRDAAPEVWVRDVGELLRSHLPAGDPLAPYAERLTSAPLAHQSLRGYLTGSIDVVLRIPGPRYLLADYKTNRLGDTAADYSAARLAEAMLHSDYPLQALLYVVVLHRFLRWRQPGYDPGPISVGCCTCSCGACADPTHPGAACSGGGRRPSWWWRFPTCSTPGDRPHDRHRSRYRPTGLLHTFKQAGVLDVADVHVAERICALGREPDERVALAVAVLVRGLRPGRCASTWRRSPRPPTLTTSPGRNPLSGWRRCGLARCWASRRCCVSTTTGCTTWTATGGRKIRCAPTWRRC